jgi:predicted CoA-binding protein
MPSAKVIQDFLAQRHLAVVGVSRDSKAFANVVFRALADQGYGVIPVNPAAVELEGRKCHASVRHVPDPLDGVLVMLNATAALGVVDDCIYRGVERVWLHRGLGDGAVSDGAVATCRAHGIAVVDGACPLMFLDHPGLVHRAHRRMIRRRLAA